MITWVAPNDCFPPHGLDLTAGSRDWLKVKRLFEQFRQTGFDERQPALVGYPFDGKIQLLSGTHRHMAARFAEILLPVTLWLRSDIERCWGLPTWIKIMYDIPVQELQE